MKISLAGPAGKPDRQAKKVRPTVAYFAAFVALGLTTGTLGPTLPALAEQTRVGLSAISYVFTARSLGYVLGAVRLGRLLDGRAGNSVMAALLLMMSLMMAAVPLVSNLWLLLITMLLLGAAEAGVDVGANTLLSSVHGNRVAPFMNALHSFFGVGALIAPLVVARFMSLNLSATNSYFALSLVILPVSLLMLRLSGPAAHVQKKDDQAATGSARQVALIALFLFLYVGAEVGFAGWIFTYATQMQLSHASSAAYLTSLFWAALTLGRMLTIPIAVRFDSAKILIFSLVGCIISLSIVLLRSESFSAVLIGTTGLGLSMASIFPTTLSFAGKQMRMSGRVTGWCVFGASVGSMLVPLVIGQAFQAVGPSVLIIVTMATLLVAVGVLAVILRMPAVGCKDPHLHATN